MGAASLSVTTPPASFIIEAARTPSTIEFFRYAPNAPDATAVRLNGSDHQSSATGPFQPVGPLRAAGGAAVNTGAPVNLAPAGMFYAGEPIIIRVTDAGQNGDPAAIETLVATIRTANGDFVTLRLYESGPDTGQFYAWIPSASGTPVQNDARLTIAHGANLTARYQDPFDLTEVSTDTAGVDPFGRVFDSLTGALIDGATVAIIDDATGSARTGLRHRRRFGLPFDNRHRSDRHRRRRHGLRARAGRIPLPDHASRVIPARRDAARRLYRALGGRRALVRRPCERAVHDHTGVLREQFRPFRHRRRRVRLPRRSDHGPCRAEGGRRRQRLDRRFRPLQDFDREPRDRGGVGQNFATRCRKASAISAGRHGSAHR